MDKLRKIISYYKPYKKTFCFNMLFTLINSLVAVSLPVLCHYVTSQVINFEKDKAISTIYFIIFLIISLIILKFFCNHYCFYKGNMLATNIEVDIKIELFEHLQNQDFSFFDERTTGKLMTSITNDAFNISNVIKKVPEVILETITKYTGVFLFLFFSNYVLASILLLTFAFLFVFMWKFLYKIQKINSESREVFSDLVSDLEENLSGIRVVKSFTNEDLSINKFSSNNNKYSEIKRRMYKVESLFYPGLVSFIVSWSPIVTTIGTILVIRESLTTSQIVTFLLCVSILDWPLWDIVHLNDFLKESIVGFNRIEKILKIKPKIHDCSNPISLGNTKGSIEFKNVCFKYETAEKKIFDNLNLKINPGEYVALVGPSGTGKSTLCNLIPRFYDVIDGEILIDGVNIKNIKIKNLRRNIGFVHQESILFSGTIYENISYGNPSASREMVIESSKKAYAHDFITEFPDGYDTHIGRNGVKLSGGQKQRIAISRVFLKDPPILIFDEATSSLDNESDKIIQKSMEQLAKNRTTIVIAHRLSTIRNAERIIVLDNGEIVEEGTHEYLIQNNGPYKKLYDLM